MIFLHRENCAYSSFVPDFRVASSVIPDVWLNGELKYLLSITYGGVDVVDLEVEPCFSIEELKEGIPDALPPSRVVKALLHLLGEPCREVKKVNTYRDIKSVLSKQDIEALRSELMLQLDLCIFDF